MALICAIDAVGGDQRYTGKPADTSKVANTSATAASTGSDLNGKAAQEAARRIRRRLAEFAAARFGGDAGNVAFADDAVSINGTVIAFPELVRQAYQARIPNASATAASSGSDLNGKAAQAAAREIKARLTAFAAERFGVAPESIRFAGNAVEIGDVKRLPFAELVRLAYYARVQLSASGLYKTPKIHYDPKTLRGRPFFYFAYGASVSEVAIDTLTGETKLLRADLLHDVGRSLNPAIDLGQVEGGFVQGAGWLTSEELWWNAQGKLMTHAPSTYKIPVDSDVPSDFRVRLWSRGENVEDSIHRSKAVGEPPLMLAISPIPTTKQTIYCCSCHNDNINLFEMDEYNNKICMCCANQDVCLETGITYKDYGRINVVNKFICNRVIHFNDCIKQYQGKQNCKIPEFVFENLEKKFLSHRLLILTNNKNVQRPDPIRHSTITNDHIIMFLKDLKYTKHYENANLIYYMLTNKRVDDITYLEDKLIDDFKKLMFSEVFKLYTSNFKEKLSELLEEKCSKLDKSKPE